MFQNSYVWLYFNAISWLHLQTIHDLQYLYAYVIVLGIVHIYIESRDLWDLVVKYKILRDKNNRGLYFVMNTLDYLNHHAAF